MLGALSTRILRALLGSTFLCRVRTVFCTVFEHILTALFVYSVHFVHLLTLCKLHSERSPRVLGLQTFGELRGSRWRN